MRNYTEEQTTQPEPRSYNVEKVSDLSVSDEIGSVCWVKDEQIEYVRVKDGWQRTDTICWAELQLTSDYGEDWATAHCHLPKNHAGWHKKQIHSREGFVEIKWAKRNKKRGKREKTTET